MFYHNTRYAFKLADQSPDNIAGGIVVASVLTRPQLLQRTRKTLKQYPHLQHRLFDPQLYLAGIDPMVAGSVVTNLGTYPWFRCSLTEYDSGEQEGGVKQWKEEQAVQVRASWSRTVATQSGDIADCVRAAVELQIAFGCEGIILPSPLTVVTGNYATEAHWMDVGLDVCRELRVSVPVYATVAISDMVLRQRTPGQNPFLETVTGQIAARTGLAGAYLVIAQESRDEYVCTVPDTLLSLLLLTDDLVRGAGRSVIVNYMGTFGAVAAAAGARIWASGFYRSQRRLRTTDMDDSEGRQYPRYFSLPLLGDVGLEEELDFVARHPVRDRVLAHTPAAEALHGAVRAGGRTQDVAEWQYRMTNVRAASAHYNTLMHELGVLLDGTAPDRRIDVMNKMLLNAERVAAQVWDAITAGRSATGRTETSHQQVWRTTFESWRNLVGI